MKKRIVPDRLFSLLWNEAEKSKSKSEYLKKYTLVSSASCIDFKKYRIGYDEGVAMLSEIYEKANMSFREIVAMAEKKKADISNTFCIPIRTVEEWYSGKNKCNSYIRLLLIRQYHLLNLGKFIYTEAEEEFKNTVPSTYKKREEPVEKNPYAKKVQKADRAEEENEFEEIDTLLLSIRKRREELQSASYKETQNVMEKTSFIDDILSKKRGL